MTEYLRLLVKQYLDVWTDFPLFENFILVRWCAKTSSCMREDRNPYRFGDENNFAFFVVMSWRTGGAGRKISLTRLYSSLSLCSYKQYNVNWWDLSDVLVLLEKHEWKLNVTHIEVTGTHTRARALYRGDDRNRTVKKVLKATILK